MSSIGPGQLRRPTGAPTISTSSARPSVQYGTSSRSGPSSPTSGRINATSRLAESITDQAYLSILSKLQEAESHLIHIPDEYKREQFDVFKELVNILKGDMDRQESQLNTRLDQMNADMGGIIDEFYQGFNTCLGNFSDIAAHTKSSLEQVHELKEKVKIVLEYISKHSRDLNSIRSRSQQYKYTIEIIEKIQGILPTQELIEKYTENRYYLHAVYLIDKTMRQLFEDEFVGIRSLDRIREDLTHLKPIYDQYIIKELSDFIYLRNSASKSHMLTHTSIDDESNEGPFGDIDEIGKIERFSKMPLSTEIYEDTSKAVESNVPLFVKNLIESLHVLNRIPTGHSSITSNIAGELRKIVEMSSSEILSKHGNILRTSAMSSNLRRSSRKIPHALVDLLNVIYVRFSAILENHAYIIRVFSQEHIKKRYTELIEKPAKSPSIISLSYEPVKQPSMIQLRPRSTSIRTRESQARLDHEINIYPLMAVWIAMQQELQEVLEAHLEINDEPTKENGDTPLDSSPATRKAIDPSSRTIPPVSFKFSNAAGKESMTPKRKGRKGVCEKSPYHILTIYKSLIVFSDHGFKMAAEFRSKLQRGGEMQESQLRKFLDTYLTKTFFPRLAEDCAIAITNIMSNDEAFKPLEKKHSNSKAGDSSRALMKSCIEILDLVEDLVADSMMIPGVIKGFISIIEIILSRYLDKCAEVYKELVGRSYSSEQLKTPAYFSVLQNNPCKSRSNSPGALSPVQYEEAEYRFEERLYERQSISQEQLISNSSTLYTLAILSDSMEWLTEGIELIGSGSSLSKAGSVRTQTLGSQSLSSTRQLLFKSLEPLAVKFYTLSELCLYTIRVELRCHCFHYLNEIKSGFYMLEDEPTEPDSFAIDFSKDILLAEELMAQVLSDEKRKCIFWGLGKLCSNLFVKYLPKISSINKNGVSKMLRNINSLHQSFSSLMFSKDGQFDRTKRYYELINLTESALLVFVSDNRGLFSHAEYRAILNIKNATEGKSANDGIAALEQLYGNMDAKSSA